MPESIYQDLLRDYSTTMKQVSADTANNSYLVESEEPTVSFDDVKTDYVKDLGLACAPKSCDALWMRDSKNLSLIEFKAGAIDYRKNYDIKVKIYDSLLILLDKIEKSIKYSRENCDLVLVYNKDKEHTSGQYTDSPSRRISGKHVSARAGTQYINFGLESFQGLYFKNVYTLTCDEFESEYLAR